MASAASSAPAVSSVVVPQDLAQAISLSQSFVLNSTESSKAISILLSPDDRLQIKSDDDEQLLIHYGFNEPVSLMQLKVLVGRANVGAAPKTIKLFVNRTAFGFQDVDSVPPTEVVELQQSSYGEPPGSGTGLLTKIPLRTVKFTRIVSLSIFIENNLTDQDQTLVSSIVPVGVPIAGMQVANIKKTGEYE